MKTTVSLLMLVIPLFTVSCSNTSKENTSATTSATAIVSPNTSATASPTAVISPVSSGAETFAFRKVADTNTRIPGGTGNFTNFGISPSLDGRYVAFRGDGASQQKGIYISSGGALEMVVNTNTRIPGGTGNFTGFGTSQSLNGGNVAFYGDGVGGGPLPFQQGIYIYIYSRGLTKVVDTYTAIPSGRSHFTSFFIGAPSLDRGNVAFLGEGPFEQLGIYVNSGGLTKVADRNTAIPGGRSNFTGFIEGPSLDGRNVAFVGYGEPRGVYISSGNALEVVANTNTRIPGGTGNFTDFTGSPSLDGGNVAFHGGGSSHQLGIYIRSGGTLEVVANTNTRIPGGTDTFFFFNSTSLDGRNVVFSGEGLHMKNSVYTTLGGSLRKVIDLNDALDGKKLDSLHADQESLSGNSVAFHASFADGSQGIFVATLGEKR